MRRLIKGEFYKIKFKLGSEVIERKGKFQTYLGKQTIMLFTFYYDGKIINRCPIHKQNLLEVRVLNQEEYDEMIIDSISPIQE